MTVDGKISNEELQQLKKKVAEMEKLLRQDWKISVQWNARVFATGIHFIEFSLY
jgi:hypothetical protein